MKRLIQYLSFAFLLFVFTGCGGDSKPSVAGNNAEKAKAEAATKQEAPAPVFAENVGAKTE